MKLNNCILSCFVRSFDKNELVSDRVHLLSSVIFLDELKLDLCKYNGLSGLTDLKDLNILENFNNIVFIIVPRIDRLNTEMVFALNNLDSTSLYVVINENVFFNYMSGIGIKSELFLKIFGDDVHTANRSNLLNKKCIFIFSDLCWSTIVLNYKCRGVDVSGGSISKRHILSSVDCLLFISVYKLLNTLGLKLDLSNLAYNSYKSGFLSSSIPLTMYNKFLNRSQDIRVLKIKDIGIGKIDVLNNVDDIFATSTGNYSLGDIIVKNLIKSVELILKNILLSFKIDALKQEVVMLNVQISSLKGDISSIENILYGNSRGMSNKSKKKLKKERTVISSSGIGENSINNKSEEINLLNSKVDSLNNLINSREMEFNEISTNYENLSLSELNTLYEFIIKGETKNINKFKLNHFTKSIVIKDNHNHKDLEGNISMNNSDSTAKVGETVKVTNNLVNSSFINKKQFSTYSSNIRKYSTNSNTDSCNCTPCICKDKGENGKECKNKYIDVNLMYFKNLFKNKTSNNLIEFFNSLKDIVYSNELDVVRQSKIENIWINLMIEEYSDNKKLLVNKNYLYYNNLREAYKTLSIMSKKDIFKKKFPLCNKLLYDNNLIVIAYTIGITSVNRDMGYTWTCKMIGSRIVQYLFMYCLKLHKRNNLSALENLNIKVDYLNSFEDFCNSTDLNSNEKLIILGDIYLNLLVGFPTNIFNRLQNHQSGNLFNSEMKLVFDTETYKNTLNNLTIDPFTLPMVCEPNEWSDSTYGGYLSNTNIKENVISGSSQHNHQMFNNTNLLKTVNCISKIKFKINTDLLKYLIDTENKNILMYLFEGKNAIQNIISLRIGFLFKDYEGPLYLPLYSDWRGRLYTKSFYITYQGNDLSLSLLEFMEGAKLTDEGLNSLYIYGANLYNQNNISKQNFKDRINWVLNNKQNILSMDSDFINNAENKLGFISFCLTMINLDKNPDFLVRMPVFLDATCSGIQHLSALIKDEVLGFQVNLCKQDILNKPEDIYSKLLTPINEKIREVGKSDIKYFKLENVQLNRNNVKRAIMIKPYNASIIGMKESIGESLITQEVNKDKNKNKIKNYIVPTVNGDVTILTDIELIKIASIIYKIIYSEYPTLETIYDYFLNMAKLLNKVKLPITWITPSGLKIVQEYKKSTHKTLAINLGGKSRKIILREWLKDIDLNKQKAAIIPNIIHSLDSSHIYKIVLNNLNNQNFPIITVHDCFGTHPNNLESLSQIVKLEFIKLYANDSFLQKFHDLNLEIIQSNGYVIQEIKDQGKVLIIDNKTVLEIPKVPEPGNLNFNDILYSQHLIT